ncbi:MAG TPA: hypothetical protein VKL40_07670 [Candidatus Angelobacter sp.]|nr:hypothetical protein [Candidatus Angelobacter sp.]
MKVRHILTAAIVITGGMAIAQGRTQDSLPPQEHQAVPMMQENVGVAFSLQEPGSPEIEFMHAQVIEMHEQIKGAPYMATAVTESTQVLADGNRIVNKRSGLVARDGEGRIRREESMGHIGPLAVGGPNVIFIHDPVAKSAYVLNPDAKTAHVINLEGMSAMHRKIEAMHGGEPGQGEGIRLKKEGMAAGRHGQVNKESLGTQQIEGVTAEGTRITRTVPAGTIGNEKPIDIVLETWTSPDLHVLVLSKRSDPRFGETVYRLTNIKRGEPDTSLFQVPGDFTTQQEPPKPIGMRRPGRPLL